MTPNDSSSQTPLPGDIKRVPDTKATRDLIRRRAGELEPQMDRTHPLDRQALERLARSTLEGLSLPQDFLGFAMVAISNVFWRRQFEAVPFARRLFLLPNCLRDRSACKGVYDQIGLQCAGCGACTINSLKRSAEGLGYRVLVAEGTPAVVLKIMEGDADAIIGVACLDSLEKAFRHVVEIGMPHVAVPLLRNGCVDTLAEVDEIAALLAASRDGAAQQTHTYVPLLREAARMFDAESLDGLLRPCMAGGASEADPRTATEAIALDWLRMGGKRLRPFVTLAAYAVGRHGAAVLAPDADVRGLLPVSVRKIALAIEALHKASLVHDDIEDDDAFRYGGQTIHRKHGVGPAVNVGDYLVGLGYRLIAGEAGSLGGDCVADVLTHLSSSHLELCRGQGMELLWQSRGRTLRPIDALAIYALKTAPAFETALYAGLRAAGSRIEPGVLRRFTTCLGEGYQVLNDLDDWREDERNKVVLGQDVLAGRPTVLLALAIESGGEARLARIAASRIEPGAEPAAATKALYQELGVFDRAERLLGKLRTRAEETAADIPEPPLRNLLRFLVRIVL